MIEKCPAIHGETYRCAEMVDVVNRLRELGKEKCLATLRQHLAGDNTQLLVLCRLLFINAQGWSPPRIGEPIPAIRGDIAAQFPLFPIALYQRVPFLLVKGYRLGGRGESAANCLSLCEGLPLVDEDYSAAAGDKAAQALIGKDPFRQLYDENDLAEMSALIRRQATPADVRPLGS